MILEYFRHRIILELNLINKKLKIVSNTRLKEALRCQNKLLNKIFMKLKKKLSVLRNS